MKISCPSCSAKYSISDEKVVSRLAKIRCRKCGATIVIDGKVNPPNVTTSAGGDAADAHEPADAAGTEYSVDMGEGEVTRDGSRLAVTFDYGANKKLAFFAVKGDVKTETPPAYPDAACSTTDGDAKASSKGDDASADKKSDKKKSKKKKKKATKA